LTMNSHILISKLAFIGSKLKSSYFILKECYQL
jgi:hypothetical protein